MKALKVTPQNDIIEASPTGELMALNCWGLMNGLFALMLPKSEKGKEPELNILGSYLATNRNVPDSAELAIIHGDFYICRYVKNFGEPQATDLTDKDIEFLPSILRHLIDMSDFMFAFFTMGELLEKMDEHVQVVRL